MQRELRLADPTDFLAIGRMLELYQYELSDIWDQDLNKEGEYEYDLSKHMVAERFFAHVALVDGRYAGFALVAPALVTRKEGFWMEQFFILKKYRRDGHGLALAKEVLDQHPGPWEVGEIPENVAARTFWRKVIARLTRDRYSEVEVTEGWWKGTVQRFVYPPGN